MSGLYSISTRSLTLAALFTFTIFTFYSVSPFSKTTIIPSTANSNTQSLLQQQSQSATTFYDLKAELPSGEHYDFKVSNINMYFERNAF